MSASPTRVPFLTVLSMLALAWLGAFALILLVG
jgi:hypothetical protein